MGQITIQGRRFFCDGHPFEYTGVSFFNAIFNPPFAKDSSRRRHCLTRFANYGINVLRLWGQWDNLRGFVDSDPTATLYDMDGRLRSEPLARLKAILTDAEAAGIAIELALFARESWDDQIRLEPAGYERATAAMTRELKPFGNVMLQIWNEHDHLAVELAKVVKSVDPARLVSNSPGFAGVLGSEAHNLAMDYLSPHTSRQGADPTWKTASLEVAALLSRYGKPVVDDEPARNGTVLHGGPLEPTQPIDQIFHIQAIWQAGGFPTYHHDMFQLGYGSPSCPPDGVPDPEFSPYHSQVFQFLAKGSQYRPRT